MMFGYKKSISRTVIYFFILLYSCTSDPINIDSELVLANGIYYDKISNKPQTGEAFSNYNDQRKKSNGNLLDGKKDGLWTEWFRDGQIRSREIYENGQANGIWEQWHENGQMILRASFKNGNAHGLRTEWYDNGKKSRKGT